MARMVPFPMLPETESTAERRLYEGFLEQLDEVYVVYHSVEWVLAGRNGPIQGEADFVIAHPERGVLVLEVKGGRLTYDPRTKRWTQSGHSGAHLLDEDPFHQAKDEMHSLVEILEAQPGWESWKPSYGYAVAFPDGRYEHDAHPAAPAAIVLDHDDLTGLEQRVAEVMKHWRRPDRCFGAEGMNALSQALGFRVEIRTPLKLRFDEEERKIVELTQDQAFVLSFVTHRGRAAITGPAGSGKTVLAIALAHRLAESGSRVLLTCFNKRLGEYLATCVAGTHIDAVHFHGLCLRLAKEAGLEVPEGPEIGPGSPYFEHQLPELLERAARALGPRYDAIVVDEAQDFREWWWPALLAVHEDPDEGTFYLFADDNQNLYEGALPGGEGLVCGTLERNVRNTAAVNEFVSVFYAGPQKPTSKGPTGEPVQILGYEDDEGLAKLLEKVLINLVDEERLPLEDIVLLTPSGKEKSRLRALGHVGRFELSDRVEPETLLATSIHSFKGLERPVVILAELGDKHHEDLAKYLYVGGSRAKNELIVLAAEPVAKELRALTGVAGP